MQLKWCNSVINSIKFAFDNWVPKGAANAKDTFLYIVLQLIKHKYNLKFQFAVLLDL